MLSPIMFSTAQTKRAFADILPHLPKQAKPYPNFLYKNNLSKANSTQAQSKLKSLLSKIFG